MYRCEACGGTFSRFKVAGQCPLCKVWASVRCDGCGYTAHANAFIKNGDRCPQCGARVAVPGGGGGELTGRQALIGLAVLGALAALAAWIWMF